MRNFLMGRLMAPVNTVGGDGGGGGTLTMDAILAEVDKRLNSAITGHFDKFKKEGLSSAIKEHIDPLSQTLSGISETLGKLTPGNPNPNANSNNPNPQGNDPNTNVLLKQLQETTKNQGTMIETLRKEKQEADERAERSERHGTIRQALSNMHFISDVAAQTAFKIVEPSVKRLDDGVLVGSVNGSDFPIDAFVKDYLTKEHPYLLRASGSSGSGAPANTSVRMGVKADLSDIKPGMKPETRESIVASIGAALANV